MPPPSSSSSSSLLLITAGALAVGSLLLISRRLFPPSTIIATRQFHTQRRLNIRRLDLSFRVGRNRRIVFVAQAATFFVHENGSRTQLWFSVRIGGSSLEKEVSALLVLMVLRWLLAPAVVEMMEEVECGSVAYLSSLRLPVIAWATA